MFEVGSPHTVSAVVDCSAQDAFAILGVPEDSIRHFEGLQSLTKESDGSITWKLAPVGVKSISLQVVYACRYFPNPDALEVTWSPVPGVGNGTVSGRWKVVSLGDSQCRIQLDNELRLALNLSRLLKGPAKKVVDRENRRLVEAYFANIVKTLRGGDGRVFHG